VRCPEIWVGGFFKPVMPVVLFGVLYSFAVFLLYCGVFIMNGAIQLVSKLVGLPTCLFGFFLKELSLLQPPAF
jgi:hypothetical protein